MTIIRTMQRLCVQGQVSYESSQLKIILAKVLTQAETQDTHAVLAMAIPWLGKNKGNTSWAWLGGAGIH